MAKNSNILIVKLINSLTSLKEPVQENRLAHLIKEINQMSRKNKYKSYGIELSASEPQPPLIA